MKYRMIQYDREAAVVYAKKWAYSRNPSYYNFDLIGGDCTNFASQCLYAGCRVMDYTPILGWYYISANKKSPSWTGVPYFYNFITQNQSVGPFGKECLPQEVQIADFIQLYNSQKYTHTLLVTKIYGGRLYVAAHSQDSFDRELSTFIYDNLRYIHIQGARALA